MYGRDIDVMPRKVMCRNEEKKEKSEVLISEKIMYASIPDGQITVRIVLYALINRDGNSDWKSLVLE